MLKRVRTNLLRWSLVFAAMALSFCALLVAQVAPRGAGRPAARIVQHRPPVGPGSETFSKEVVRILQARCQTCHRERGIAPFPLMTYSDAFLRKEGIRYQTRQRNMPPWHAGSVCYEFLDNPSLAESEIEALDRWVAAGAPEGDPRDLPPPLSFPSGWELGEPDNVQRDGKHAKVYQVRQVRGVIQRYRLGGDL